MGLRGQGKTGGTVSRRGRQILDQEGLTCLLGKCVVRMCEEGDMFYLRVIVTRSLVIQQLILPDFTQVLVMYPFLAGWLLILLMLWLFCMHCFR